MFCFFFLDVECCVEFGIGEVYIFFMSWNNVVRDIVFIWELIIVLIKEWLEVLVCVVGVSGDVDG